MEVYPKALVGVQEMTTQWEMEEVIAPALTMRTKLSSTWRISPPKIETGLIGDFNCNPEYLSHKKRFSRGCPTIVKKLDI